MDWVPLADYEMGMNLDDRPRRLSPEEIAYITAHLPTAPSADSTAASVARQGIVDWMVDSLRELSLCPSAVPDLIQRIVEQHNKSLVVPGTPVGITAAEAVGATTTQMTLNSVAPHEKILVQDFEGDVHLLKIGEWIDGLMKCDATNIVHVPGNGTQYLELKDPVYILSPDENGKAVWSPITAVTKHTPVGDLVKIITKTGREATVTRTKSLLVWDGKKLVQRNGASVAIGDQLPVFAQIPDPVVANSYDNLPNAGSLLDVGLLLGTAEHVANKLRTLFELFGSVKEDQLEFKFSNSELPTVIAALCGRLGIITEIHDKSCIINRSQITKWVERVGFTYKHKRRYMELFQQGYSGFAVTYDQRNDIILDPIVSIETVPATEYVYDLTVPATTNFSLWNGLGVADTFHSSGSAKSATFGIDAMRDLIFARKNPKNESCTIYFNNKRATYEEVLDSRQRIVGSVVSDFILKEGTTMKYDIDTPEALPRYWWHDQAELLLEKRIPPSTKVLRLFLNVPEMFKHHVTIKELAEVLEREVPPSAVAVYGPIGDGIIDLYPHPTIIADTLKGREKGVIPLELAELTYLESVVRPELENIRVKGISGIRNLVPVVSPVWRIVLHERKMVPGDVPNDPVARERLAPGLEDRRGWLLFYNQTIMLTTGLIPDNLAALCQLAGLTILGGTQAWLAVAMPNDRFRTAHGEVVIRVNGLDYRRLDEVVDREGVLFREINPTYIRETAAGLTEEITDKVFVPVPEDNLWRVDGKVYRQIPAEAYLNLDGIAYEQITDRRIKITEMKPNEYVADKVNVDKRTRRAEIKRLSDAMIQEAQGLPEEERRALLRRPAAVPRTPLMIASEFIIAETDGSNLKELLALPEVDKTRTTCNNMYTITKTLGIEAARTFVIRALSNTIANTGSYVHPANIMFIAEFITSRGEPYGATYTGISRQPGGHLSLATLERAGKVFTQNALHGRKEDIRNVSASVAVGARMAIGDGAFDIAQDIVEEGVPKTIMNDDLFTALERDDETKQRAAQVPIPTAGLAPTQTIAPEDLAGGIDLIKTITLGGTFDHIGAEDETNLLTLFNRGEAIPEITAQRPIQPAAQAKVVRRVQAQPVLPTVEVPRELVDVLTQIKIGAPLPEGQEAEAFTIKPVEVVTAPAPAEPIVSTGLIPLTELLPQPVEEGFPQQLEALFEQYEMEQVAVTPQELPRVEIPELPELTADTLAQAMLELRREQVRGLQPINTTALQTALAGTAQPTQPQ